MTPEAILLSIRDQRGEGSYRFSCPECLTTIEKPADRKVVALLLSAGVELADVGTEDMDHEPEWESYEPLEVHPGGPPFTSCYPATVLVVAVLLAIGLASLGLLAVLIIALVRHVKLLASSLRRFQDEVRPILEEIQQDSESAQDKMQRMSR